MAVKSELGLSVPSDVSSVPQDPPFVQREHATYSPFTCFCFRHVHRHTLHRNTRIVLVDRLTD